MDIVTQGTTAIKEVPVDLTDFELEMVKKFKQDLGITETVSRQSILVLEHDLGFNLITKNIAINNYTVYNSKVKYKETVDILNNFIERYNKDNISNTINYTVKEVDYIIKEYKKHILYLKSVLLDININIETANRMLHPEYTKYKTEDSIIDIKDLPLLEALSIKEYWEVLDKERLVPNIANIDINTNSNIYILQLLYKLGTVIVNTDMDVEADIFVNSLVNITLELFIRDIVLKKHVIVDNIFNIYNFVDSKLLKLFVEDTEDSYINKALINFINKLETIVKYHNKTSNDISIDILSYFAKSKE